MKKLLVLFAALCLGLLCACGDGEEGASRLAAGGTSSSAQAPEGGGEDSSPLAAEPPAGGAFAEPPSMDAACELGYVYMLPCGYEWTCRSESGEEVSTIADSAHPLELQGEMPRLNGAGKAWLRTAREFPDLAPDQAAVRAWPDTAWGDASAEGKEVPWEEDGFQLLEGGWVYELTLTWTSPKDWGGTARYCFWGVNTPEALALEEDGTMVEDPPAMEVSCGEETFTAARGGGGDWSSDFLDSMVVTGGGHDYIDPIKERDNLPFFSGEPGDRVSLSWECPQPDQLTVTALSPGGESREVPWEDYGFSLEEGEWIYTVSARWVSHNKWGGEVNYAFVATDRDQTLEKFPYAPPRLTLFCEASHEELTLRPEGLQWSALLPDGSQKDLEEAGAHPLERQEDILWLIGIEGVDFTWEGLAPDQVTVEAWPAWGETDTPPQEVEAGASGFTMLKGEWVYQVTGVWSGTQEWSGQASYCFLGAPV